MKKLVFSLDKGMTVVPEQTPIALKAILPDTALSSPVSDTTPPWQTTFEVVHEGKTVYCSIHPSSWQHKPACLRTQMSLVRLAFAAESVFALDKEITGLDQVPLRDLQVLAAKQVMRYLSTNGIADLEAVATEWTKVREDAAGAMAAYAAAERARAESMAAKMKAKGYTHRVSGWIHPTEGDDYPFEGFTVGTPSPVFIGKLLAKSEVKNDYVVTEI